MQVFNPSTQQLEDVTWTADDNNELIATFSNGRFLKFPAGLTKKELESHVKEVRVANEGQEVLTPEYIAEQEAARKASEDLATKMNGNTMPDGQTDEPVNPET